MQRKKKKIFFRKTHKKEWVVGLLSVHPKGFGFVRPEGAKDSSQDFFIPSRFLKDAVDQDLVEVEVLPKRIPSKGKEGRIVAVLRRGRTHLAGTILEKDSKAYVAYVPLLGSFRRVFIHSQEELLRGDRVILKVIDWNDAQGEILCEMTRKMGNISDAFCDVEAAIQEYQLPEEFSPKAIEEASVWGCKVSKKDLQERKNLSELLTITIDPESAKDFDDALSLSVTEKGHFHLGVHIADVAHYVKNDSFLDKEAFLRCNSTYFPGGKSLPMLPEVLSHDLCSLKPELLRLSLSILMEFDPEGKLLHYEIVRAFIKSDQRFTYEEASSILQGAPSPFSDLLKNMAKLSALLKEKRFARGSIDFALFDWKIILDPKGEPVEIQKREYDLSHQLVEEFMLKANEVVATHLNKKGKILIYRIHEEPEEENFQEFYFLARSLGFHLPEKPRHEDIQQLFLEVKDTPYLSLLSVQFIKSMRLAYYSSDNLGHFGLALDHYCHFTSPIRRYTDLVTQRLLFDEEKEGIDLASIANICSLRERISLRAEGSVKLIKKLRLLKKYFYKDPQRIYSAVITGVKPHFLVFELTDFGIEGSFPISSLKEDFFIFEPHRLRWVGSRTKKSYSFGDFIEVMLLNIDFIFLKAEWSLYSSRKNKNK